MPAHLVAARRIEIAADADLAASQSAEVARLRVKLGLSSGNYFGPVTKKKLTERQTQQGQPADGIFTPELDTLWGWDVF